MKHFNPSSPHPKRAQQAWMILVGLAMNRQTITYKGLSEAMYGKPAAGVLGEILGHIAAFCMLNQLPQLNVIVVNMETGLPGEGIPLSEGGEQGRSFTGEGFSTEREMVYRTDWFDIAPPRASELSSAWSTYLAGEL